MDSRVDLTIRRELGTYRSHASYSSGDFRMALGGRCIRDTIQALSSISLSWAPLPAQPKPALAALAPPTKMCGSSHLGPAVVLAVLQWQHFVCQTLKNGG